MKYILWTGGWDSTFRLLQLASDGRMEIQPIYVHDAMRAGHVQEQRAMQKILSLVAKNKCFPATIHSVKLYDKDDILRQYPDAEITASWKRLNTEFALGGQYEWLALLCKHLGIRAELGLERSERSKALHVIYERGGVIATGENLHSLDCEHSSREVVALFRFYEFGITTLTKHDMYRFSRRNGWYGLMKHTWFCHTPVRGKPCGTCNPCRDAMNEDMQFRMPLSARLRYYRKGKIL